MKFLKNLKHIFAIWGVVIFLTFGIVNILGSGFIVPITQFFTYRDAPFQNFLYTQRWKPSVDQIAIIKIDDNSLNQLQATSDTKVLNIPKTIYIDLIKKLQSVGVVGIAFDIVFANKDPDEALFAKVLEKSENIVIALAKDEPKFSCIPDEDQQYTTCTGVPRSVYKNAHWGLINISQFVDKRILTADISNTEYSSWKTDPLIDTLPLALYKASGKVLNRKYVSGESVLNPYFGSPGTYPMIAFIDVLHMSKRDLVATFAGKYIFIGENGTLIHDEMISPITGTMMPGVETHAHMLDGILQNRIPVALSPEYLIAILLVASMVMVSLYFLIPHIFSPFLAIVAFLFTIWLGRYMYGARGIVFDVFPVMLAMSLLSFPITFIYRFFIVDRERRKLQKNFSHYIDPVVVQKIADMGGNIKLGGEEKEMSVLFSDIAGFTTLSEKLDPTLLFSMMTAYLSRMTDILMGQGGTLDKYIGDAVMGFFGAPLDIPDHAIRACHTALIMRQALPAFNQKIALMGIEPIDFRVGIASGDVIVGNIGSEERFNYTVLGDTVNIASRLEGIGKEYAVHIVISENTRKALDSRFFVRELDTIAVKGKVEGLRIFELIGHGDQVKNLYAYEQYARALALYREGNYRDAGILWEKQAQEDPPSRMMMDRCLSVLNGDTRVENGVYHMTHK